MTLRLREAVDVHAEERIEFDRLLPIEGCYLGLDPGDGKRALLRRMKEAAEKGGGNAQT